jgi:hemoglobin/transferrin/lactoferrin receptor protein
MAGTMLSTSLYAQSTNGIDLDVEDIEEVTVTATRVERLVFTTPTAVSVLSRDNIQLYQPLSYADVLEGVPGVAIQGGSRRISEEPNIRGFLDNQVVIRLDNARQNFDLAHRGRFFVDPDLVNRIEVLRGSASALYGSGALGGVISVETIGAKDLLREGETFGVRAKVGYQSNGDELLTSAGIFGKTGPIDIFGNIVYRQVFEDLEGGSGNPIIDTEDRLVNGLINVGIDLAPHHRLEIIADSYDNEGENPTAADAVSTDETVVDRDTRERNVRVNYHYNDLNNAFLNFSASAFYTDIDVTEDRFIDGRADVSDFSSRGIDINNTSRFEGEKASLALTLGFEWFEDEQSGTRDGIDRLQFPDAERSFTALYAQAEIELFDIVSIIPGIRYDDFSQEIEAGAVRDDEAFTPRVAVGLSPTDWLYLWGSWAEAFRAPGLTELFNDGTHFTVPSGLGPGTLVINQFVPTPNLLPEEAESFEFGARVKFEDETSSIGFQASATYFTSDVDDFVNQVVTFLDPTQPPQFVPPFGPTLFFGTTESVNVDANISGFEAEARFETPYVSASISGFTVDGDDLTNNTGLGSIPQDSITFTLNGTIPDWGLRLGGRATIASAQRDVPDGSVETDGYETVDLFVTWAPKDIDNFTLTAGIDNLFDEAFSIHPTVIEQPGRSFRVTLSHRFGG